MLEEIKEQPQIIKRLLNRFFCNETDLINLHLNLSDEEIKKISDITILASGSSKNVGNIAAAFFEKLFDIKVSVEFASEFLPENSKLNSDSIVIAISQSGETADTYEALKSSKNFTPHTIALTNNPASRLCQQASSCIIIEADKEKSIAATKTVTAQLLCMIALGLYLALKKGKDKSELNTIVENLENLPEGIESLLNEYESIKDIACEIKDSEGILFISKGTCLEALKEGSLKIKETSYIMTEVLPSGEALHGHFAVLDKKKTLISSITNSCYYDSVLSNTKYLREKSDTKLVIIKNKNNKDIENVFSDDSVYFIDIPNGEDYIEVFYIIIVCQLLAYYISSELGYDTQHPRYLSKVVK